MWPLCGDATAMLHATTMGMQTISHGVAMSLSVASADMSPEMENY
jgi:hypothetical protein